MKSLTTLFCAALLAFAACDSPSEVGEGRVTVLLTDAPGDVLEAWVTIEGIELIGGGEEEEAEGEGENGPTQIMSEPVTTDLLTLVNDVETLAGEALVAAGEYRQMRFVIPAACIVVESSGPEPDVYSSDPSFLECGEPTGSLQIPSYGTSGLKVLLHGERPVRRERRGDSSDGGLRRRRELRAGRR